MNQIGAPASSLEQANEWVRTRRNGKKKLGVDFGIFAVVYFQLCQSVCERVRKLSAEFPVAPIGKSKAADFSGFIKVCLFRCFFGMIEHQMDDSKPNGNDWKQIFGRQSKREKKKSVLSPMNGCTDAVSIFLFRIITKSKSFRMNKLHAWVAPFCFYIRCISIDTRSLFFAEIISRIYFSINENMFFSASIGILHMAHTHMRVHKFSSYF